eukprot:Hpha_TRINITY_DN679_c0_g1::TRINITY_DN679_c0_g1_i1::g.21322::m.21322/K08869/ADCK, ABC1; aarF domain-containing kinase
MSTPSASPASPPPEVPPAKPKIDNVMGMQRAMGAQQLFELAKKEYRTVIEKLEAEGFTRALTDKEERNREEYARIIQHPSLQPVHTDIAKRCLALARQNGGIYNKAAQFIASLQAGSGDTGIPKQFVEELRQCTDQCPPRPFSDFHEMIQEELGKPWDELFEEVESPPIGAASLAQVHRARTKEGKTVALKLQYPGLHVQLASDFFIFRCMAGMIKPIGLNLETLLHDFERTVTEELDFEREAINGETTRHALAHLRPQVYVPATIPALCSKRTLAMEFVGNMVPLRPERLRKAGISVPAITKLVSETFAEMACCQGRVHGDPHAGNVYARNHDGKPQIVILDHGLYHMLDDEMRVNVCKLLLACASRNKSEIKRLGELFAGPLGRLFPLVLSPWFIFGAPITLSDIRAAYKRQLPPGVSLKEVGETLVKLYEGGGKTIGLLHSFGYTRGLLNDLGCSETQRLTSLVCAARLGLEPLAFRPGADVCRAEPPRPGAELATVTVPKHSMELQLAQAWVVLQVWIIAIVLWILWPIAMFFEPKKKKNNTPRTPVPEPPAEAADAAGSESKKDK